MSDEKKKDDDGEKSKEGSFGSVLGPDFRPLGRRIKVKVGDRGRKLKIRKSVRKNGDGET